MQATAPLKTLRSLSAKERALLGVLRALRVHLEAEGGRSIEDEFRPTYDIAPFVALIAVLDRAGIAPRAPDAAFVGEHERAVLAGIAFLQRRAVYAAPLLSAELDGAIGACAASLDEAGITLPLTPWMLATLVEQRWIAQIPAIGGARRAAAADAPREPAPHTLRWRAVEMAKSRPMMRASDLREIGISRQHLSLMVSDGLLERIGSGLYRLARKPGAPN